MYPRSSVCYHVTAAIVGGAGRPADAASTVFGIADSLCNTRILLLCIVAENSQSITVKVSPLRALQAYRTLKL
jgi:hypothetical protein